MKKVLCLGLTPGLQRTLVFDRFEPGEVNRAVCVETATAGKALHVAMVLAQLGQPAVTTGFNGGSTGRELSRLLRRHGVRVAFVSVQRPTRICTTIIDRFTGSFTELVEEMPPPSMVARARWDRVSERLLVSASALALCGTLPPFMSPDCYEEWTARAVARHIPVFIDSHRDPLLKALGAGPLLVKMNTRELEQTLGLCLNDARAIRKGASMLCEKGAHWALITHGAAPAVLVEKGGRAWTFQMPRIQPVNPIGAGDAVMAGLIHGYAQGLSMPHAAHLGFACGVAETLTLAPGAVSLDQVHQWRRRVKVSRAPVL